MILDGFAYDSHNSRLPIECFGVFSSPSFAVAVIVIVIDFHRLPRNNHPSVIVQGWWAWRLTPHLFSQP